MNKRTIPSPSFIQEKSKYFFNQKKIPGDSYNNISEAYSPANGWFSDKRHVF